MFYRIHLYQTSYRRSRSDADDPDPVRTISGGFPGHVKNLVFKNNDSGYQNREAM